MLTCTLPDPPSCSDLQGQLVPDLIVRAEGDEGANSNDCYYSCKGHYDLEGVFGYQCTYSGLPVLEDTEGDDPLPNEDTEAPEYCNNSTYDGTPEGTCIDYDHPDNEGGCGQHGKHFGTFGTEFGSITGCFGGGTTGYEPDGDVDGDGIPNEGDDDIDGDGILNDDDPDENGDGINEKKDTDGDGIPDSKDSDIDGDGIPNGVDNDKDGDGIDNEDDATPDGDGKSEGQASTCGRKPNSQGDAQLAAIHMQLWLNQCQGNKNPNKEVVDKLDEIKDEFENLTEEVENVDADKFGSDLEDEAIGEMDGILDDYISDIDGQSSGGGPMDGIASGSGIDDALTSFLPSASACTPLQLTFASKFSVPIPCEKFIAFKEWFGWALSYYTIYAIIMLALAPVPSKV
ncbi:hypothetical protein [uncultured Zhongshania sp.]|uniref:hypothetical protein n=1 Tax=uncultured Zhongshania sp. TaxID=1642288 RepID=UPI0030DC67CB|tara:strand:+ start:17416 stop:18615 length:1200 start_codon:yes stop_codon:yes gene_type:complete